MISLGNTLGGIALVTGLFLSTQAMAEPEIAIDFESDAQSGEEFVRAETGFRARRAAIWNAFAAITEYPNLHEWIREARFVGYHDDDTQEFLIEFEFPWPIGKRWSRVAVTSSGSQEISWRQIDGDLDANEGRISFSGEGEQARIHYRAVISVGVPAVFARPYKKQFVCEFLNAMREHVADTTYNTETMALASH